VNPTDRDPAASDRLSRALRTLRDHLPLEANGRIMSSGVLKSAITSSNVYYLDLFDRKTNVKVGSVYTFSDGETLYYGPDGRMVG
jgi:hypothetical protein